MTTPGAPHIERCTSTEVYGTGPHARTWQCLLPNPHPDEGHDYGIEGPVYGRVLHEQRPEWLAATLIDVTRRQRHTSRQLDAATAAGVQLARALADISNNVPISDGVREWVRRHAPEAAEALLWDRTLRP